MSTSTFSGAAVPALAEQRAGADEHGRGALDEQRAWRARPTRAASTPRRTSCSETSRPSTSASHSGSAKRSSAAASQRLEQDVGVLRARSAGRGRRPAAGACGAVRSSAAIASSAWRAVPAAGSSTPVSASSGRWAASSASHSTSARSALAARVGLGGEHLDEPERLGLRAGQQPVDLRRAAADALAGELEAELAQRGGDRVVALGGLARAARAPGSAARSPRAARASPRGRAAGGRPRRAARRREPRGRRRAGSGRRRGRASGARFWNAAHGSSASSSGERRRSRRRCDHPGRERDVALGVVVQRVISSRKRVSCSASQSRSAVSGSVSQASSW